jgi:hypothetical protein
MNVGFVVIVEEIGGHPVAVDHIGCAIDSGSGVSAVRSLSVNMVVGDVLGDPPLA